MIQAGITPEDIADKVVRLSRTFRAGNEVSMYDLLADTGYLEHHDRIGEDVIRKRLALAPELISEWLIYSEDKRTRRGWYFRSSPSHGYEVGYFGGTDDQNISMVCTDRFDACAKFVKKELEEMRGQV